MTHQFNKREVTPIMFYSILLNKKHPFYDENGRTFRILFAKDDKRTKLLDETRNKK